MDRRSFLRGAAALGGLAATARLRPALASGGPGRKRHPEPLLSLPASEAPIDTIVIVMMENRSFDHYFGWLPGDEEYMEAGRSRYGHRFSVAGNNRLVYAEPDGTPVPTYHLTGQQVVNDPTRGCGHPDPGHGWDQGRTQRDHGFLARGSGNDVFAIGYFEA